MSELLFPADEIPTLKVNGETAAFPVNRIFCVGRNYVAHAQEMGGEVDREAPWYFTKFPQAACLSGATVPFPPGTDNYHHEMELVIALGGSVFKASKEEAMAAIYAYGCGLDMTRRDRQQDGKDHRRPWDLGKNVENGAVLAPLTKAADFGPIGAQRIHLEVNDEVRQDATLDEMVWAVDEIVSHLSHFYHLRPGDIIMTGTPAGVGAVQPGDRITGGIDGLDPIALTLGDPE